MPCGIVGEACPPMPMFMFMFVFMLMPGLGMPPGWPFMGLALMPMLPPTGFIGLACMPFMCMPLFIAACCCCCCCCCCCLCFCMVTAYERDEHASFTKRRRAHLHPHVLHHGRVRGHKRVYGLARHPREDVELLLRELHGALGGLHAVAHARVRLFHAHAHAAAHHAAVARVLGLERLLAAVAGLLAILPAAAGHLAVLLREQRACVLLLPAAAGLLLLRLLRLLLQHRRIETAGEALLLLLLLLPAAVGEAVAEHGRVDPATRVVAVVHSVGGVWDPYVVSCGEGREDKDGRTDGGGRVRLKTRPRGRGRGG
jgi:hypothetical protein